MDKYIQYLFFGFDKYVYCRRTVLWTYTQFISESELTPDAPHDLCLSVVICGPFY